jgi:hypothetical protein
MRARDVPGGEAEGRHPHRLRVPLFTREVEGADKRGARGALVAVDSGLARVPSDLVGTPVAGAVHRHIADRSVA